MGLIPRYNARDIERTIAGGVERIENDIVQILRYLGEQFVSDARQALNISGAFPKGDYHDRTSNLRSSIGYFVLDNGQIIGQDVTGTGTGRAMARKALEGVTKGGYQLVGVAGMEYASYVESMGYNVITSQADTLIVDLRDMLKQYQQRMNSKGVAIGFDAVGEITGGVYRS